jgi:VanZ family protein
LWLLVLLFPLNWLREESPFIRRYFDALFMMEWVHVLAHLFIYAGLVMLIFSTFKLELNLKTALLLVGIILLVGGVQEYFQLLVKGHGFGGEEVFDLGVDLAGGALGWLLAWR